MFTTLAMRCRKRLAASGLAPAVGLPAAFPLRDEDAAIRPARLIEDPALRARPLRGAVAFDAPVAQGNSVLRLLHYPPLAPGAPLAVGYLAARFAGVDVPATCG